MLSTTELFVEHIISGILSLLWIIAIMLCFTGIDTSILPVIRDFWGLFAVVTTAIAYPVGIFVDTFADKLLTGWNQKIKRQYNPKNEINLLTLIRNMKDTNITNYFTYNRFKTRIARSSFINFAMIGIAGALLITLRGPALGIERTGTISLVIFVTFILLSSTALFLWREIARTVYQKASRLRMESISPS